MHEFSIVENILDIVTKTASDNKLTKVTKIKLIIGKMRQIVPETMQFVFEIASKETLAKGADLQLHFIPVVVSCNKCLDKFTVDDNIYFCEKCQSTDITILKGMELLIEGIEGE